MKTLKLLQRNLPYILLCAICVISVIINIYVAIWLCEYYDFMYRFLIYWTGAEVWIFIYIYRMCKKNSA